MMTRTLTLRQAFGKKKALKWARFAYTGSEIMVTLPAFQS
jgi:hypothetical protein